MVSSGLMKKSVKMFVFLCSVGVFLLTPIRVYSFDNFTVEVSDGAHVIRVRNGAFSDAVRELEDIIDRTNRKSLFCVLEDIIDKIDYRSLFDARNDLARAETRKKGEPITVTTVTFDYLAKEGMLKQAAAVSALEAKADSIIQSGVAPISQGAFGALSKLEARSGNSVLQRIWNMLKNGLNMLIYHNSEWRSTTHRSGCVWC